MTGTNKRTKLIEQVRHEMRLRHMSLRTEEAYVRWVREFLHFHRKQNGDGIHPNQLKNHDINQFLTMLAVERNVAASTQNQALSAILLGCIALHFPNQELTWGAKKARFTNHDEANQWLSFKLRSGFSLNLS